MRRFLVVSFTSAVLAAAFAPGARADGPEVAVPAADPAERAKWGDHMGDLPFVVGYEKGMKAAATSGRPPLYFFTATW